MSNLTLVRGLPGSGKSTVANKLAHYGADRGHPEPIQIIAADDWFDTPKGYEFDPALLSKAHDWCRHSAGLWLDSGWSVIVHNTFTTSWELETYMDMCDDVTILSLFHGNSTNEQLAVRNSHDVPLETIARMRDRWELIEGEQILYKQEETENVS